jgi:hypothetical protein
MTGVMSALKANDHVGATPEPIDDLALAFVAPLGADDGDVTHEKSLFCEVRKAPTGGAAARPASVNC